VSRHVDEGEQVERIQLICIEHPLGCTGMWHETMVDELEIAWLHGAARRLGANLMADPNQTVDGSSSVSRAPLYRRCDTWIWG
jgi:hypothetical protein